MQYKRIPNTTAVTPNNLILWRSLRSWSLGLNRKKSIHKTSQKKGTNMIETEIFRAQRYLLIKIEIVSYFIIIQLLIRNYNEFKDFKFNFDKIKDIV